MADVQRPGTASHLAARLERGDVIQYAACPFPLAEGDDRRFLLEQRLAGRAHKNISYDPGSGRVGGYLRRSAAQAEHLRALLAEFSRTATAWVASELPAYAAAWKLDQVSFRPEEEAVRHLRRTARNDLLHVDAFPSRPTNGWRLLRLFVNVNPSEPRVWVTSDAFPRLIERYGREAGLPAKPSWVRRVRDGVRHVLHPGRSDFDAFMLRFHNFLKSNDGFQERSPKRFWQFPPGSAWLVMTDTASHAALRGRFALEHSYFVSPHSLALPEEAPAAVYARTAGGALGRAA
jgi:hypothetical protein